jgi:hypothetical protein
MQSPTPDWRDAKEQIKDRLTMPEAMKHEGWRVSRNRKRADCGLCGGKEDVALTRELFHCHRCGASGDVIRFVELVHDVKFVDALKHAAHLARVELPIAKRPEEQQRIRQQLAQEKEQRSQIEDACDEFEGLECSARAECRRRIRVCDDVFDMPGPWDAEHWNLARVAYELREEFLLPEYLLLSFAQSEIQMRYLVANDVFRATMLAQVCWKRHVVAEDGKPIALETIA